MSNRGSFARRLRAEYRKKILITAIVCLLIGALLGYFGGRLLNKNPTDATANPALTMAASEAAPEPVAESAFNNIDEAEPTQPEFAAEDEPEADVFENEDEFAEIPSEAEPETEAVAEPEAEPETEAVAEPEAEPETEAVTEPEEEPETAALLLTAAEPEVGIESADGNEAEPEATAEPTAEPTPEVTPEPTPEPTPEVTPEPTPIVVPYGEPITFESQVTMDGGPRRDASDAEFETLNLTVQLTAYKDFNYFEQNYGDVYDLKGGTAAAEFNITLNNYEGTQQIIPQNCLLITFRGESDAKTTQGYQLIDKEIAGSTGVMLINNQPVTCYKRYAYDETLGEMRYMVLTAYNNGAETTYWFDIKAPEPDPTPTPVPTAVPDVSKTLHPGETSDAIKQMQEALIAQGYLDAEATGYYGPKTMDAVKAAQKAFGLTADGIAGKQFFSKIYNMEIN